MKTMIRFAVVLVALNAFAWRAAAQEPEVSEAETPEIATSEIATSEIAATAVASPPRGGARASKAVDVTQSTPMQPKAAIRLPKYFASLVNDVQRQEINQLQLSYRERVQALAEQLAALKAAELAEAEQILSKGQREQLEEMRIKGMQRAKAMPRSQPSSATSPSPAAVTAPAENSATIAAENSATTAKSSKAKGKARTKPSEPVVPKVD